MMGNPINGFKVYGPFKNIKHAEEWGNGMEDNFWISELQSDDAIEELYRSVPIKPKRLTSDI